MRSSSSTRPVGAIGRRALAVVGASALSVLLGACASDAPASPSESATAEPEPSASTPASAAPEESSDASAASEGELGDTGFATLPLPEGWTLVETGDSDSAEWLVSDASGEPMLRLLSTEGQYAPDGVDPECTADATVVESRPVADAGTADDAGDAIVAASTIEERDGAAGRIWQVRMGVAAEELVAHPTCEVFYAAYPADDTSIGIEVVPVPQEALDFATREDAEAYTRSDEHATLMDVLEQVRITA